MYVDVCVQVVGTTGKHAATSSVLIFSCPTARPFPNSIDTALVMLILHFYVYVLHIICDSDAIVQRSSIVVLPLGLIREQTTRVDFAKCIQLNVHAGSIQQVLGQ